MRYPCAPLPSHVSPCGAGASGSGRGEAVVLLEDGVEVGAAGAALVGDVLDGVFGAGGHQALGLADALGVYPYGERLVALGLDPPQQVRLGHAGLLGHDLAFQVVLQVAAVSQVLHLPLAIVPLCTIVIGHPAESPEPKNKWKAENVSYNDFGGKAE